MQCRILTIVLTVVSLGILLAEPSSALRKCGKVQIDQTTVCTNIGGELECETTIYYAWVCSEGTLLDPPNDPNVLGENEEWEDYPTGGPTINTCWDCGFDTVANIFTATCCRGLGCDLHAGQLNMNMLSCNTRNISPTIQTCYGPNC